MLYIFKNILLNINIIQIEWIYIHIYQYILNLNFLKKYQNQKFEKNQKKYLNIYLFNIYVWNFIIIIYPFNVIYLVIINPYSLVWKQIHVAICGSSYLIELEIIW